MAPTTRTWAVGELGWGSGEGLRRPRPSLKPLPPGLLLPWRWLAVAGEGPVLIMILLLSFMPNSPRFLLSKSRDEEALQALTWLRADSQVHWEFEQIQDNVRRQVQHVWFCLVRPLHSRSVSPWAFTRPLCPGCLSSDESSSC